LALRDFIFPIINPISDPTKKEKRGINKMANIPNKLRKYRRRINGTTKMLEITGMLTFANAAPYVTKDKKNKKTPIPNPQNPPLSQIFIGKIKSGCLYTLRAVGWGWYL